MITKQEILDQKLVIYIYVGDNKEGTAQFRRVRHPENVDVPTGYLQMWVEDVHLDEMENNLKPVVVDPNNPPESPKEISVEATLKEYRGHVILFNTRGEKIDETPTQEESTSA